MMNFEISNLPERTVKPRSYGVNMIMDKGLSIREAENMIQAAGHLIDFVKLGFGTSLITGGLDEKIDEARSGDLDVLQYLARVVEVGDNLRGDFFGTAF